MHRSLWKFEYYTTFGYFSFYNVGMSDVYRAMGGADTNVGNYLIEFMAAGSYLYLS